MRKRRGFRILAELFARYNYDGAKGDSQAADLFRCLRALEDGPEAVAALRENAAVDSTGLIARHLLCDAPLSSNVMLSRAHPLFRKRLAEKNEAKE